MQVTILTGGLSWPLSEKKEVLAIGVE